MKRSILPAIVLAALLLATPSVARAADDATADDTPDARLFGYPPGSNVLHLDDRSSAYNWLAALFLVIITMPVMFKNPNRSHLD